jgi:hypothetical protein
MMTRYLRDKLAPLPRWRGIPIEITYPEGAHG